MLQRTIIGLCAIGMAAASHANVTVVDTTFNNLHWQHEVLWSRPTASMGPITQQLTGGNPGAYQRGSHQTSGVGATIYDGHFLTFQPYNPGACWSIRELDVSYDYIDFAAGATVHGLAVRQDGNVYIHVIDTTGPHASWRTFTRNGIRVSSNAWQRIDPVIGLTSGRPNFSTTGGVITFGYYVFNTSGGTGALVQREWGIDNFRVVVKPCACDFDLGTGSRVCDVFDFLAFSNALHAGSPCACNYDRSTGNNVCDIFDFLAFQNAFFAGCD